MMTGISIAVLGLVLHADLQAQERWTPEQSGVIDAMAQLTAATRPDGGGPAAYGAVLADGYSRWTLGGAEVSDRQAWLDGMRGWWDEGWRVTESDPDILEIAVRRDLAFVRRNVAETYRGPAGETTGSHAALAEVWQRTGDLWQLLRVDIYPLPAE